MAVGRVRGVISPRAPNGRRRLSERFIMVLKSLSLVVVTRLTVVTVVTVYTGSR